MSAEASQPDAIRVENVSKSFGAVTALVDVSMHLQKGEVLEITKDGDPVPVLAPRASWDRKGIGFARIEVKGALTECRAALSCACVAAQPPIMYTSR